MPTRVQVIFLGGTIGMTGAPGRGASPRLDAAELLAGVPLPEDLEVEAVELLKVGSSHLTFPHVLEVAQVADRAVEGGVTGVVVVQGTDSMEETAYLLDLGWRHDAPLVLTGAMRNPGLPGPDGPANLAAAIAVAVSPRCRGLGVTVVLNDELHAARHVAKQHTSLPSAFGSPGAGPVGRMLEGEPVVTYRPERHDAFPLPGRLDRRVGLFTATLDDDPAQLRAVAEVCDGLVVAGFGAGHLKADVADAAAEAAQRVPVVLTSRAGSGSVHTRTYAGKGSEEDLLGRRLVNGGHLAPLKARLLLTVLLGNGSDRDTIAEAFIRHG